MKINKKPTYKELEDEVYRLKLLSTALEEKINSKTTFPENIDSNLSENKLNSKLLFENMPSAFIYAKVIYENDKPIDFQFIEVNRAFNEKTGLKNVIGKKESEVRPGVQISDPKMFEIVGRVATSGVPENVEYYINALGKWISAKIFSPKKGYFISISDDITARKQAEKGLINIKEKAEEGENYLNNILNNIGDPIFVKDDQSKLLIVNDAFCKIFGLKRASIIGKTLAEEVPHDEQENFLKIDKQVIRDGIENVSVESLTIRGGESRKIATRKTRFINYDKKIFLIGVIRDMTERYKVENELKIAKEHAEENEERFRILMLNMEAGVIVHAPDTSIIQSNVRASELLGLSKDQLKGKKAINYDWKFVKTDKSPLPFEEYPVNRIASSKTSIKDQHLALFQPDKEGIIWLSVNGFPVLNNTGEIIEIVTIFIDITEQKLFEEAQVKHQRLKAIGEMSSSIAHDFNNSLQEMMGNLEVVKLQKELSESTIERLNNIRSIINDAAGRVSALQKFGDPENENKNTDLIDLNQLIEDSLKQSRPLWKDNMEKEGLRIKMKTDFKDIPKIKSNSGELKSVIYNLIKNSIEAMPDGGDITIKTGVKAEGIFATFTDTGIGMDDEAKLKVFEPFFTTKGFKLGRGLGMSGAYSIIKKYGGDIILKSSELGKGTSFEVVFPSCNQNEVKAHKHNEPKEIKPLNILWVDDDLIITKSACMMVESIGHKCITVNSGNKAIEYFNNNSCDIVFTDIGMPKMNGWELADTLRTKFGNKIKIVAVTGWIIEEEVKEKHGIDYVLQKPFSLGGLKEMLEIMST